MGFLAKLHPFSSIRNSRINLLNTVKFSTLSKRRNPSKPQNTFKKLTFSRKDDHNNSLFNEITAILGSGNLAKDKSRSGYSLTDEFSVDFARTGLCTQGVCENAQEKNESKNEEMLHGGVPRVDKLILNDDDDDDNSDIVHKITHIVRESNAGISVEQRLDDTGSEVSSDVVVKVLKRCFKVPHLANRFFSWVKLKNERCLTTECYNTMLYISGEAKEFELVESLVQEMENFGCEKDIKTWTVLVMHYGKANLIAKALLIFEKMKRLGFLPDAEAYRCLIRVLCQSKKAEIALEYYKEMVQKGYELDNRLYTMLLNCLADSGDTNGVYIVANDLINICQIPEHAVYSCVLKSFCVSKRIREALELIRDLKNKNLILTPDYFETLVKGLCKADKMDDALEIFGIMKRRDLGNEVIYGALISGYLRKSDFPRALDLFHEMKGAGITPLTSTYTELMQHFFKSKEYEKGCDLYNEMLESGVKLDSVAYASVIAGHARNNSIADAWNVFESMEKEGIRATQNCYLVFIKQLCRNSNTDEMIKVLNKMQSDKINIGKEIRQCVFSYLRREKEPTKLVEVNKILTEAPYDNSSEREVHNLESDNIEPNVENFVVKPSQKAFSDEDLQQICAILSSTKDWFDIQEAIEDLKIFYTPELVTEILHRCGQYGQTALKFFSWVQNQTGYRHTTETYNMAMKIAGRGKDFKHMRNIFSEMQSNGCMVTSDTWTIMILLYGRVGLTDIALKNFNEMKSSKLNPTASTYKYLIISLCGRKGRNLDEALKLFKEMINKGLNPDKELVEVLFDSFCQANRLDDAKKCLEILEKVGFSTALRYSLLIRALLRRNKVDEALALADSINEDRSTLDRYIYGSLINSLLQSGLLDKALAKIDAMKNAGIHPTVHVYTSLITHFCKEKQIGKALDLFKKMWQEGCYPTVVTYTTLLCGYINLEKFEDARKLFTRMRVKGPTPDFKVYSMLIVKFCEMGKSEEAMQLLGEMMDDGIVPSTINYRTVFFGLNREGKHHLARRVLHLKHGVANKRKFSTS